MLRPHAQSDVGSEISPEHDRVCGRTPFQTKELRWRPDKEPSKRRDIEVRAHQGQQPATEPVEGGCPTPIISAS
jgi:hypothetical protein